MIFKASSNPNYSVIEDICIWENLLQLHHWEKLSVLFCFKQMKWGILEEKSNSAVWLLKGWKYLDMLLSLNYCCLICTSGIIYGVTYIWSWTCSFGCSDLEPGLWRDLFSVQKQTVTRRQVTEDVKAPTEVFWSTFWAIVLFLFLFPCYTMYPIYHRILNIPLFPGTLCLSVMRFSLEKCEAALNVSGV